MSCNEVFNTYTHIAFIQGLGVIIASYSSVVILRSSVIYVYNKQ